VCRERHSGRNLILKDICAESGIYGAIRWFFFSSDPDQPSPTTVFDGARDNSSTFYEQQKTQENVPSELGISR